MMGTIDQLLAQAEAGLEQARRRHEIAQAIAEDWSYWAPLLGAPAEPAETREAVAEPPAVPAAAAAPAGDALGAPQAGCKQCGGPIPPRASGGGRPKVFCSQKCGRMWQAKKAYAKKKAEAAAAARAPKVPLEIDLPPEPLGDIRPEERLGHSGEYEDSWLRDQLAVPKLPWEGAPARTGADHSVREVPTTRAAAAPARPC